MKAQLAILALFSRSCLATRSKEIYGTKYVQTTVALGDFTVALPNPKVQRPPAFEVSAGKKVSVFDLDECMIFEANHHDDSPDRKISVRGLETMPSSLMPYYDLAMYTATNQERADAILEIIDPKPFYFPKDRRRYRTNEFQIGGKDLTKFGIPLTDIILVDDRWRNFELQSIQSPDLETDWLPTNGFHVQKFKDGVSIGSVMEENAELIELMLYLANKLDVRPGLLKYNYLKRK